MAQFSLENPSLAKVIIENEKVYSRTGAMVAYDGKIKFSKAILGGEGLFGSLKRKVAKEKQSVMTWKGNGAVYFAHEGREVSIIELEGGKIFVESSSVLAYDESLETDVAFAGVSGAATKTGLFTTTIEGTGSVALIAEGTVIPLVVTPEHPVFIDPDAFIAYKGDSIHREFILDVNWKTVAGMSSGETFQIKFSGDGVVYVQPSERK